MPDLAYCPAVVRIGPIFNWVCLQGCEACKPVINLVCGCSLWNCAVCSVNFVYSFIYRIMGLMFTLKKKNVFNCCIKV